MIRTNVAPFQILYQDEPLKIKLSRQDTSPVQPDVTILDASYKVKEETVQQKINAIDIHSLAEWKTLDFHITEGRLDLLS